ncbi:MAG: mechanosensitive ion channel family protein [Bacteroidetes bacterium]|nr:mechanosensitive ion channel family protein [Bacteroidota bacterium]MBU2506147.1 mechanosensitive ion channel family protein [Bacteroidota bacterium]
MRFLFQLSVLICFLFANLSAQGIPDTSKSINDSLTFADSVQAETDSTIDTIQNSKSREVKSTDETSIMEEGEVQEKLENIFSISKIIWSIIFLVVGFYFLKLLAKILDLLSEKSAKYRITLKGMIPIIRILGWTTILSMIVLVIFAPPTESLVVVTGSMGLAIGFSSQDILKNIFGGIMIIFDRTFQVGDKVQIGEHYGEVLNIGLRSTRIVTADDSVVSIPNGDVMNKSVSNSNSGETNCQVVAEIYLPVYVDTAKAKGIAIQAAQVSKMVFLNKPIAIIFKNEMHFGKPMLKMRLKAYVLDIRYEFAFMSEMTENTIRELIAQGIISKEEFAGVNNFKEEVFAKA